MDTLAESYLTDVRKRFAGIKRLGDGAMSQVTSEQFFRKLDGESNSIALILKHVAGNMRSRWTDFLTTDGEKPDRKRDLEFVEEGEDREALMRAWESAWEVFLNTLSGIREEDLLRTVTIRGEPHSVLSAINRQLEHYGYHVGQIVLLAKHFKSEEWQTLSIARGESGSFNERMRGKFGEEGKA